jgi:hypothetical protein
MSMTQGTRDALADAETLAQSGVLGVAGDSFHVVLAALFGIRTANVMRGKVFAHRGAFKEARAAARAAFRAVPGLRG